MIAVKITHNPYNEISTIINSWCEENFYDSFIVTILRGDQVITEYLAFDGTSIDFVWENDWWEGEAEIYLLGFWPLSKIKVYGNPAEESGNGKNLKEET